MSTTALAVRSRASLPLRLLYGRRAVEVGLSPPAARDGLRGWFRGARVVRENYLLRVERSPWPLIASRAALLVALLAVAVACWPAALVACCGYLAGVLDARLR